MFKAVLRFIFPSRQIISSTRLETGHFQFAVASKGWFEKYRDVDIYKLTTEGLLRLAKAGGWEYFTDESLEMALHEEAARLLKAATAEREVEKALHS